MRLSQIGVHRVTRRESPYRSGLNGLIDALDRMKWNTSSRREGGESDRGLSAFSSGGVPKSSSLLIDMSE
jgi:hypothetical protein